MRQYQVWTGPVRVVVATPEGGSEPIAATWVVDIPPHLFESAPMPERLRHAIYLEFEDVPPGSHLKRLADAAGTATCRIERDGEAAEMACRFLWSQPSTARAIHPDPPRLKSGRYSGF